MVRPPLFLPFGRLVLLFGATFALVWGGGMAFLGLAVGGVHPAAITGGAVLAGALFGLAMGFYYRRLGRKLRLNDWEHYAGG